MMKKIKFFNSIAGAELVKNLLKEHGINASVQRRGLQFPGDLGDSYGADLFVPEKDVKKAEDILGEEE
ncbi:MAG: DUF2007 domain-containing protein [Candidatus Paceibacterota bacterium]|jgi:hypothetical protein|nr:DUF2007 domain-containing protein [Candidatus Paceibacterota bacterium]MDD5555485.1 DUF2007 domain-containing protein [Candidatus Paceibacterota bacterium]